MSKGKDDYLVEKIAGANGEIGCGILDRRQDPPSALFVLVDGDGRIAGTRVTYPSGLPADASVGELAASPVGLREALTASKALEAFGLRVDNAEELELVSQGELADVAARLNPEAIRALRATDSFTQSEYAFYAAAGTRGERRRQAADVYPLLAGFMARQPILKMAIDMSKPLNEALQKAFGVDDSGKPKLGKAILKRLQGVEWAPNGVSPVRLGSTLANLPPDWFPRTREDWDAFCVIADTVGRIMPNVTGSRMDELCAGCGGKWVDYARRLAKAYMDTRPPLDLTEAEAAEWQKNLPEPDVGYDAMRNACLDAEDMASAFSRLIVLPVAAHTSGEESIYLSEVHRAQANVAAARVLFAGKSAGAVFELSRHWHTQQEQIENAAAAENAQPVVVIKEVAEDGWAPLCNPVQAPNGVWLIPLTDPRELQAEGSKEPDQNGVPGLEHCVGGYSASCRRGESHILSVRTIDDTGTYRRLSTVEFLGVAHGDVELRQRQNRGVRNGTPSTAALEAVEWFMRAVRDGAVPLNYDGIRTYLSAVHRRTDDVRLQCGYDWTNAEQILNAMKPWGAYVGKAYRRMGLEEFAAVPEVSDVVELIAPRLTSRRMP